MPRRLRRRNRATAAPARPCLPLPRRSLSVLTCKNSMSGTGLVASIGGWRSRAQGNAMNETARVPDDIGALIVSPTAYATQKQLMSGFRWLRRNNPLGLVEADGFDPFWAVTRYADIVEISRRHDLFNNGARATTLVPRAADQLARSVTGGSPHLMRTLLQMDAPEHTQYRQLTQAWFTRQQVGCFEDRIRLIARRAIDRMAERDGCCDFARDVAPH